MIDYAISTVRFGEITEIELRDILVDFMHAHGNKQLATLLHSAIKESVIGFPSLTHSAVRIIVDELERLNN